MNSINHIHVPRCSGIYLNSHIVSQLKSLSISFFTTNHGILNENSFLNKKFISGHYGMTPSKYRKDLINTTMIRNPVDRYLSNFLYIYKGNNFEKDFDEWLYNPSIYNIQSNLQTKCLSSYINEEEYNKKTHGLERANFGWCLESVDLNVAKQTIDSCDIVGIFEDHQSFLNKYNNLLLKTFGFTTFPNRNKINGNFSKIIISDTMKSRIEDINSLDMELYEYAKNKK